MLELPESFVRSAATNVPGGRAWLRTLPDIFGACVEKWNLTDWVICEGLVSNLVCTAASGTFGAVVLKVEGPNETRHTEPAALRAYGGRHACKLLDVYGESARGAHTAAPAKV